MLLRAVQQDLKSSSSRLMGIKEDKIPTIGVLFGTHNWESCQLILDKIRSLGLGEVDGQVVKIRDDVVRRLTMGQLYGAFFCINFCG
jgi:proline dehydrogenase